MTPRTIRNPVTNTLYTIRPRSSKAGQKPVRGLWANPPPEKRTQNAR